jgi:hypothetical protein
MVGKYFQKFEIHLLRQQQAIKIKNEDVGAQKRISTEFLGL